MLSIAVASNGIHQDSGARMIHNAKNTSSTIVSKSISKTGGSTDYRGTVRFGKHSDGSKAHVECDTIIMDDQSSSDTIPFNEISNANVSMEHEAKVSKISEEQLYYLMSRGITEAKATEMIVMGFVEPFTKQLPMEYAVELNRLISFEMEGSIG
jgi:Fe-S cluster assembly protein SufB